MRTRAVLLPISWSHGGSLPAEQQGLAATLKPSLNGSAVQRSRSTFIKAPTVSTGINSARFPTTDAVAYAENIGREQERVLASASNRAIPAFFGIAQ